jgi:nucleotide-binding universal stress UspA family protein
MSDIRQILFPVDLSEACRSFAPVVRSVACRAGARVTLLNVLQLPPNYYSDPNGFSGLVDLRTLLREQGAVFSRFLKAELADLPDVHRVFRHGDPAGLIVEYAAQRDVDLIMMPTRGTGIFRRLLIGSVTAKVLHDADIPVWTAPHLAGPRPHPERYSKILCAVDLSDASLPIMQQGQRLAQLFGAQLRFLHVIPSTEAFAVNYFDAEFVAALANQARDRFAELAKQAGAAGNAVIRSGDLAHAVRQEALDSETDLIVIGSGVLKETLGRMRTQSYAIIRESPCAVLSV